MTRAKERLVLSGALTRRQSPGNFLALLTEGSDDLITKTVIPAGVGKRGGGGRKKKDAAPRRELKGFEARWRAREDRWAQCRQRSLYLTPSQLKWEGAPLKWEGAPRNVPLPHPLEGAPQGLTRTTYQTLASAIGGLVHKALEDWSYRDAVEVLLEQLDRHAARWLPDEFKGNRDEILTEAREVLEAFARSDAYGEQARIYTEAVRHALGHRPAGFKVIFLRLGQAVPVVL